MFKTRKFVAVVAMCMVALLAFSACGGGKKDSSAGGSRKDIDAYLKSYEQLVVSAEKAAKSNKMSDLMSLADKAAKLAQQAGEFESSDNWTTKDAQKLLDLTNRYTKAVTSMSDSLDFSSFGF